MRDINIIQPVIDALAPWYYRVAPLFVFSLIDDPAMLALAFC